MRFALRALPTALLLILCGSSAVFAAVGRTPGQYTVGLSGDAQYVVPLWTPPGTNGLAPALSLSYSSAGGNGWLGRGFVMPAFSVISRCNATVAQDAAAAGFTFTASDRYCLDGRRLRHVSGTYAAAGSSYQTELESFRKVTVTAADSYGPAAFEVRTPEGLILEYGNTVSSRIRLVTGAGSLSSVTLLWAVNRVRDRAGNYMDFTYTQDALNGGYYPQEIRWTGHTGGTAASYRALFVNEIADRPDTVRNQFYTVPAGTSGTFNFTKRLARIEVSHLPSSRVLRAYQLTYEAAGGSGGLSRLQSLRECGLDGADCLAPTQLAWTTPSWNTLPVNTGQSVPQLVAPLAMDITGDGRDDLVWPAGTWLYKLANASGGFGPTVDTGISAAGYAQSAAIRWDGDTRQDLIVAVSGTWAVMRANGTGFDAPVSLGLPASNPSGFADINGDGLPDMIRNAGGGLSIRLGTGSGIGFGPETLSMTSAFAPVAIFTKRKQDFNGDGREDLVVVYDRVDALGRHTVQTQTVLGNGNTLVPGLDFGAVSFAGTGDFNGDGRTDVAWISGGVLRTTVSPGSGPSAAGGIVIMDWNGDGKDDAVIGSTVVLSSGTGFGAPFASGFTPKVVAVGDVDGDTFADLVGLESGQITVLRHSTSLPWYARDLLQTCTDGYGVTASFSYGTLNEPAVHTPSSTAVLPQVDLADASVTVVKTLTASDGSGSGATYALSYTYEGAKLDLRGRGFLGFARRTVVDPRLGFNVRTEEVLLQSWPFVGLVERSTLRQSSGAVVRETTNTWRKLTYEAGQPDYRTREYPYLAVSTTNEFEAGGIYDGTQYRSVTTALAGTEGAAGIDAASGLVIDVTTTTTERASGTSPGQTHTQRLYQPNPLNDLAQWCIGRPKQTQRIASHSLPGGTSLTRTMDMAWDAPLCRPTQSTVEPGDSQWQVTTDYGYDAFGNVASINVIPAPGQGQAARLTTIDWGTSGQFPLTVTNPKSQTTRLGWDAVKAVLTSVTDANALGVSWTYQDSFRRLTREVRPDGTATDYSLVSCTSTACQESNAGIRAYLLAIERDTANAEITRSYRYLDLFDREVLSKERTVSGADSLTRRAYDARGSLLRESQPYFVTEPVNETTFSYDLLARPTLIRRPASEADSSAHDTRFTYQGLTTLMTDALGRTVTYISNAAGLTTQVLDAAGNDTDYEYDAFGSLTGTRDFNGNEIRLTYNVRGMKLSAADPALGTWRYSYYPLGELKTQTNAKGQQVSFDYDVLSRPIRRSEPEGETRWSWDTAPGRGIGQLDAVDSPGGYRESYGYDSLGRLSVTGIVADGTTYELSQGYSPTTGLLETLTYPVSTAGVRFKVRYGYQYGLLQSVSELTGDVPGTTYWQAIASNARGQLLDEQLGNGLRTISGYDRITGELNDRTTTTGGGAVRQDLAYSWNKVGSLTQRRALDLNLSETFYYDSLGRLDYSQLNGVTNLDVGYDVLGNVTTKSDLRLPVASTTSWSSYNLPTAIEQADGSYSRFQYAADRSRYREASFSAATGLETTISIKGLYERVTRSTGTEYRHSIRVPGGIAAIHQRSSSGTNQTVYLLKDHLGSLDVITSATGDMLARLSYSAFGERRNGATWSGAPSSAAWSVIANTTRRGFTGHEHLDSVGLIHMNGRVFDPGLGQFTSADPFVQAPFDAQNLNRYSYVYNDPLSWVDPSGYCGASAVNVGPGGIAYGSNQASLNTPCPISELEQWYNSFGRAIRERLDDTPITLYSIRESGQFATLALVNTANGIGAAAQVERGGGANSTVDRGGAGMAGRVSPYLCAKAGDCSPQPYVTESQAVWGTVAIGTIIGAPILLTDPLLAASFGLASAPQSISDGVPPVLNVSLARSIANGLVRPGGKLAQVLGGIENGFVGTQPKNALQAAAVVQRAATESGLDVGIASVGSNGQIILKNVGGVVTTLGTDGSIVVTRGSDLLLRLGR